MKTPLLPRGGRGVTRTVAFIVGKTLLVVFSLLSGAAAVQAVPVISLTAPPDNSVFAAPATFTLVANATDSASAITQVRFFKGAKHLGTVKTPPYEFTVSSLGAGDYTFTAEAIDENDATATSIPINLTVYARPKVSLTSPAPGSLFTAPATITLAATASDTVGTISEVDFYQGTALLGIATIPPYTFIWNNAPAGTYSLTAVAKNSEGQSRTSRTVKITINAPPSVSLTSPVNNSLFSPPATIMLVATAADPDGKVTHVQFYNGATLLESVHKTPYQFTAKNLAVGNYTFTAAATDNRGAIAASTPVNVTVDVPPTVSLTVPVNHALFIAPASVTLAASASTSTSTIAKVDFFQGTTLLGTVSSAPYQLSVPSMAAGSYTLTAVATDGLGVAVTSASIVITVDAPPTAALTGPANNALFVAPAAVTLTANASDEDGAVAKVDFYQGATLLGTATSAPYLFNWTSVPAGSYTLTAVATDNVGATGSSSPVNIVVDAPPSVSLTTPANNALFIAPASIALTAAASDADGTVAKVDFYQGTILLGTATAAPHQFNWTNAAAGNYTLTAKATDDRGVATVSSPISVTVDAPPTVALTAPKKNALFIAPAAITLAATAGDPDGAVAKVDFYQGTSLLGTATTPPYQFSWTGVAAGNYTVTAKATDNVGASTLSPAVTITVDAPPTISLTVPTNNAFFVAPASITLAANANDSDGTVTEVDFYQGSTLLGAATTPPYQFNWTNVVAGNYTLTAAVTDNDGAVTVSSPITVTVDAPPTVVLTAPANNAVIIAPASLSLAATASDSDGTIGKVEFFNGSTSLGLGNSVAGQPGSYTLSLASGLQPGSYALTAVATDNAGVTTTSSPVDIVVDAPPTVTLTAPANNAIYTAPATVTLTANATATGSVAKVDFYQGSTLLGTATTAPYQVSWTNVAAGSYTLTAVVTDNYNLNATSAPVSITVNSAAQPPTITPAAPSVTFSSSDQVSLSFGAIDSFGTVTKVELYRDGDTTPDYTLTNPTSGSTWTFTESAPLPPGTYTYVARAYNNYGQSTDSSAVTVTVLPSLLKLIDFEPGEGYTLGPLDSQLGWSVTQGEALVTGQDAFYGSQSVVLQPGTSPAQIIQPISTATNDNIIYVDLYAKPSAEVNITASTTFDIAGARFAFLLDNSGDSNLGVLEAFNGNGQDGGQWGETNFTSDFAYGTESPDWIHLTVRLDFTRKTWDLYANGVMIAADLAFDDNTITSLTSLAVTGDATSPTGLDTITIGLTNPLFADVNNDGIDDAWEQQYNLSLSVNDRYLDPTNSGQTVVQDYINGVNPNPQNYAVVPAADYSTGLGPDGLIAVNVTPSYGSASGIPVQFTTAAGNLLTTNAYGAGLSTSLTVYTDDQGVAFVYVRSDPNNPNASPTSTTATVGQGQSTASTITINHPPGTLPPVEIEARFLSGSAFPYLYVTATSNYQLNGTVDTLTYTYYSVLQLATENVAELQQWYDLYYRTLEQESQYPMSSILGIPSTLVTAQLTVRPAYMSPSSYSGEQAVNIFITDLDEGADASSGSTVLTNPQPVDAQSQLVHWDQTTNFSDSAAWTYVSQAAAARTTAQVIFGTAQVPRTTVDKVEYKFVLGPNSPSIVTWLEEFSPIDGSPSTFNFMSWMPQPGDTQSPAYTIDPLGLDPNDANAQYRHPNTDGLYQVVPFHAGLAVDANRDGEIHFTDEKVDSSKDDSTSSDKPFRFWVNDGVDGYSKAPDESSVQDDLDPSDHTPNCVQGYITCARDLENLSRLWIDLKGLVYTLQAEGSSLQIGLKWKNTNNTTPAINLYLSADPQGSPSYLTNDTAAQAQIAEVYRTAITDANGKPTVDTSGTFIFPNDIWPNLADANPVLHLLFEGESVGTGQLTLVILDANGNELGEGPSVWMDLRDIKQFYERWTVGDGPQSSNLSTGGGGNPYPTAGISSDRLPTGIHGLKYGSGDPGLSLPGDPAQNEYILFVHGWNLPPWEKDAFAETALKRLYWQGYKGKFGTFEWPTTYSDSEYEWFNRLSKISSYDDGEFSAWQSAVPLERLLLTLHNTYGNGVYLLAHSMGNVVAGEALRIAGQSGAGQLVNTYVASQAAVPAHCYDPTLPNDLFNSLSTVTPNIYNNWLVPPNQSVGSHANFYNVNDYAMFYWRLDQGLKPDTNRNGYSYYYGSSDYTQIQDLFKKAVLAPLAPIDLHLGDASNVQDRYEIMAYASQPWSYPLCMETNVAGFTPQNLPAVWPKDPFETDPSKLYSDHPWHSAEFRFTNADMQNYWHALLGQNGFDLLP